MSRSVDALNIDSGSDCDAKMGTSLLMTLASFSLHGVSHNQPYSHEFRLKSAVNAAHEAHFCRWLGTVLRALGLTLPNRDGVSWCLMGFSDVTSHHLKCTSRFPIRPFTSACHPPTGSGLPANRILYFTISTISSSSFPSSLPSFPVPSRFRKIAIAFGSARNSPVSRWWAPT